MRLPCIQFGALALLLFERERPHTVPAPEHESAQVTMQLIRKLTSYEEKGHWCEVFLSSRRFGAVSQLPGRLK